MKKTIKIILIIVAVVMLIFVLKYFRDSNSKSIEDFETATPFKTAISTKAVATGKVNPEEEIEIKPQISGIVDEVTVEEGDKVKKGDLIAKIRVVPDEQALVSARGRINSAKIAFSNAETLFNRNKTLFEKGVISKQDFEDSQLSYNQSKESLQQAQNDFQIIKRGSLSGGGSANTNIIAQIAGTVLEIPVREGDQVIESNNFNDGTTVATIADLSKMIFEGKVDEAQVGKINEGQDITVILGAIQGQEFPATLTFVAPKGNEENGAVQFTVKADVNLDELDQIRAGYSANAEIGIEAKNEVLAIKESLLQFHRVTDKPFVEVKVGDGQYEKRNVTLGISDGINIEIIKGVEEGDEIKVWNKASKDEEDETN